MTTSFLELTVAIVKPHAAKVPHIVQGVRRIILNSGFYVVRSKQMTITQEVAEKFYSEHKNKFFYGRLITSMTSGPSDVYILARENAIQKWRELMGPTKVFQAKLANPDSIRGMYGLTDTRNVTHGSDSMNSSRREITLLFPKFDVDKWYQTEEPFFRNRGSVHYDAEKFVHKPIKLSK